MSVTSIEIKNLLSFDHTIISHMRDFSCIIGRNNTGKSNLSALLKYFYSCLANNQAIPPGFNNPYSPVGSITLTYDLSRIRTIVTSSKSTAPYHKKLKNIFFPSVSEFGIMQSFKSSQFRISLKLRKDNAISWNVSEEKRSAIRYLFPLIDIDTRHIDLHDWDKIWEISSRLKSFNFKNVTQEKILNFFDEAISSGSKAYSELITKIEELLSTQKAGPLEKSTRYIQAGVKGRFFTHGEKQLITESDGTNSHKFILSILQLSIALTRREFISPIVFVDEPEIGLHPKKCESLIESLFETYASYKKTSTAKESLKYNTPYPKIFIVTHSPNILKSSTKLFKENSSLYFFSKGDSTNTKVTKVRINHRDTAFMNVFRENEARLFFSNFIFFVEGQTELELFTSSQLLEIFPVLKKIDVYNANNLHLRNLVPTETNLPIPFLVLYDADMLFSPNLRDNQIKISLQEKKEINLQGLKLKLFKKIPSYETLTALKRINSVQKDIFRAKNTSNSNLTFDKFNLDFVIRSLNRDVLESINYRLTFTTIEGVLINLKSLNVFLNWLKSHLFSSWTIKNNRGSVARNISIITDRRNKQVDIKTIFRNHFEEQDCIELTYSENQFRNQLLEEYFQQFMSELNSIAPDPTTKVNVLRLIFGGKSNTLVSLDNKKSSDFFGQKKGEIKDLMDGAMSPFKPLFSKTSGWVSRFLEFAVESAGVNETNFQETFEEISDIINRVSASIV